MPQSLSKVYVHITFSTKHRKKLIDDAIAPSLYEYLGGICKGLECFPVQVGGYQNHVHILCTLSRKIAQMKLLEEVKKRSSKWIKTKGDAYKNFYWQDGFGIFSVSQSNSKAVTNYIKSQKEHHSKKSFKDEIRSLLNKHSVEFNENYIWD